MHKARSRRIAHREHTHLRIIAVINAKGGSGKSTLALHLAVAASQHGRNVAVLDLDPQQTAARWGERREAPAPAVSAVAPSRLGGELGRIAGAGADMVFLDTPPRWTGADTAAREAARVAHLVVVPVRPTVADLEATVETLGRMGTVTAARVVVVLNGCLSRGHDADEATAALAARGVDVCAVRIGQRVMFARSLLDGLTAQEVNQVTPAANEVRRLYDALNVHIEHTHRGDR